MSSSATSLQHSLDSLVLDTVRSLAAATHALPAARISAFDIYSRLRPLYPAAYASAHLERMVKMALERLVCTGVLAKRHGVYKLRKVAAAAIMTKNLPALSSEASSQQQSPILPHSPPKSPLQPSATSSGVSRVKAKTLSRITVSHPHGSLSYHPYLGSPSTTTPATPKLHSFRTLLSPISPPLLEASRNGLPSLSSLITARRPAAMDAAVSSPRSPLASPSSPTLHTVPAAGSADFDVLDAASTLSSLSASIRLVTPPAE